MYDCTCNMMKSSKVIKVTTFAQNQFMICYLIFNFRPTYYSYFRKITALSISHNVRKLVDQKWSFPVVKGLMSHINTLYILIIQKLTRIGRSFKTASLWQTNRDKSCFIIEKFKIEIKLPALRTTCKRQWTIRMVFRGLMKFFDIRLRQKGTHLIKISFRHVLAF